MHCLLNLYTGIKYKIIYSQDAQAYMSMKFQGGIICKMLRFISYLGLFGIVSDLQEYMWFLRTLRLKKPLHPSQLEAP